ncbi:DUF6886 family protein [Paenibacillus sp. KN14-4R]|uniref:DUF6886 family protein n=1 Tax=Paenibacillus sp. KN14-4R TaxID=3445773 RepID=UPI003FA007A6
MNLYHFSEEPHIEIFHPRVKYNRQDMPPVVWAIDDAHAYTFYFPRKCPRIVVTRSEGMSDEVETQFFGHSRSDKIITVETSWYKTIRDTTIYRYAMPSESFQLFDATAGYYISEETITPYEMISMNHLIDRLIDLNIEVRLTPNLHPLCDAIVNSDLQGFSIHQFDNARQVE